MVMVVVVIAFLLYFILFLKAYLLSLLELFADPSQPLHKTVSCGRTGRLDVPRDVAELLQLEPLCDLVLVKCFGQVALVGKDQDHHVLHVRVCHNLEQLCAGVLNPLVVGAVHNVDQCLCPRVVVPPQRTELLLAANVLWCVN